MVPSDGGESPISVRDGSPLSAEEKRAMVRELDRAVRYGSSGLETSAWTTFPGCAVTFGLLEDDRIELRITYDESRLPGPVTVRESVDEPSSLVSQGTRPTGFVDLSAAHGALYEDVTDAAGRAVDPYAVTVPDTPVARSAGDATVTFLAILEVLTGQGSAERRTVEWE